MAKFYIASGEIHEIVTAETPEQAALEALDRFFEAEHWVFDEPGFTHDQQRDHLACEALLRLDSTVRVSEKGFERDLDSDSTSAPWTMDPMEAVRPRCTSGRTCQESPESLLPNGQRTSSCDASLSCGASLESNAGFAQFETADLLDMHFRMAVAMRRFLDEFPEHVDCAPLAALAVR